MTKIVIIGSGVVGQATGRGFLKKGHQVTFVDTNTDIIQKLSQEGFNAYSPNDFHSITADVSMFCTSTPSHDDGSVNLDNIIAAVIKHSEWLTKQTSYHLVVIRNTVPPTTTRGILLPLLERCSGKLASKDFGLCVQPEFLRATSAEEDFLHPRGIVIGELDQRSGTMLSKLYADFGSEIFRVNLEAAELIKYINNSFEATKISFFNEIWQLGQKLDIDTNSVLEIITKIVEGLWNPKYGIVGGRPYGGNCLPKDTKGLLAFSREIGVDMPLLSAVVLVNNKMVELAKQGIVPPATITRPKWQLSLREERKG